VDETPEMRARLEAQRAYFSSDERIRERAALWIGATPKECLVAVYESCEETAFFLSRLDPASLGTDARSPAASGRHRGAPDEAMEFPDTLNALVVALDLAYVRGWLIKMVPSADPRLALLDDLERRFARLP